MFTVKTYNRTEEVHIHVSKLRLYFIVCAGITVVVTPLDIIQRDQLAILHDHGITACRLDICGNATTSDEGLSQTVSFYLVQT